MIKVANLRQLLEKERAEALDREARLNDKINGLSPDLRAATEAVGGLSADVSSLKEHVSLPKSLAGKIGVKKRRKSRKVPWPLGV